jgi:hypothetical protein
VLTLGLELLDLKVGRPLLHGRRAGALGNFKSKGSIV